MIYYPDKLNLQIKKFKDPKVGLVYGKCLKITINFLKKTINYKKNLPEGYITKQLLESYPVGLLTIMLRKKFLKNSKNFKIEYNYLGDLDFVLRFSLKYKFAAVQKIVGIYRQNDHKMKKKNYLEKSIQFTKWYKKILSEKTFGGKENFVH